jgi:putative DNA primase/helicase
VIIPDNDEPGRKHAEQVRESLTGIARSVTVLELPGLPPKGDVSDWLRDHGKDDLLALVERARTYTNTGAPDEAVTTSTADYHRTDYGNALRLIAQHGKDLRYNFQRGRWLIWNGKQWAWDKAGEVTRKAKDAVRAVYSEAAKAQDSGERRALALWASRSEAEARLRSMISLARDEVPVLLEDLDRDPWLLNVANGTLDLRTGELRPHRREDLITKLAPVEYDPNAKCPLWKTFLNRIFGDDEKIIGFVQRATGYALTGSTREQVLFMLYGTGANGKSTFLETLRAMLGDYAQHSDFSTFIARNINGPRNDIARLNGARLVTAQEIQSGQRLDERLVKQLTGGDTVTARFLYGENFEFKPTFKLFLAANHKPVIRGTDHAIWRRIRLIPFTVTIPDKEQDKDLAQKLQGELAGVLAWAVQGCLQWQKEGLAAPAQVTEATKSYREEMDILGGFLEEKCVINKLVEAKAKDLYQAYLEWCEETGEKALTQRKVGMALTERGFQKEKTRSGIVYTGIGLLDVNDRRFTSFTETDPGNTHYKDSVHDVNDCDPFSKKSLMRKNKKKVSEKGVQSSTRCTTRNGSAFAETDFVKGVHLSSFTDRPYTDADNEEVVPF